MNNSRSLLIVIPAHNEEGIIEGSVLKLAEFLERWNPDFHYRILITDNASTDGTLKTVRSLAGSIPYVSCLHLGRKGRGYALNKAWTSSVEDVLCYMDADLSTALSAIPGALSAIDQGCDIVSGSRRLPGSRVKRSLLRKLLSSILNLLLRILFQTKFTDTQCGFKVMTKKAAVSLLPRVRDKGWFFDSELLLTAESLGFRCAEIPVQWKESSHSGVRLVEASARFITGMLRLKLRFIRSQEERS